MAVNEMRVLQKQAERRYTLGIVYEPNTVDSQGDYAEPEEIEKACWDYMKRLQGSDNLAKSSVSMLHQIIKTLHEEGDVRLDLTDVWETFVKGDGMLNDMHMSAFEGEQPHIVECYIAPVDFALENETIKKGTWLMGIVWPESYFDKIKAGERTGLSMEGYGRRIE